MRASVHELGLAAAALALLAAGVVVPLDSPFLFCPFRAATGLPCLTCGCTHAFHHFVRGDLVDSFLSSPLGFLLAMVCALHVLWTIARACGLPCVIRVRATGPLRWAAAAVLAANWAFLLVK